MLPYICQCHGMLTSEANSDSSRHPKVGASINIYLTANIEEGNTTHKQWWGCNSDVKIRSHQGLVVPPHGGSKLRVRERRESNSEREGKDTGLHAALVGTVVTNPWDLWFIKHFVWNVHAVSVVPNIAGVTHHHPLTRAFGIRLRESVKYYRIGNTWFCMGHYNYKCHMQML